MEKRFISVLTICALLMAGFAAATPAHAAPARPTVTPAKPIASERITVTGTFGKKAGVRIVAQKLGAQRWSTIASTRTRARGAYSFSLTMPRTQLKIRVKARHARTVSATGTVRAVPDTVALTVAGSGTRATATVTASAPRAGRSVWIERRDQGQWVRVAAASRWGAGRTHSIPLSGLTHRSIQYRATLGSWRGAPTRSSARVPFAPATFTTQDFDVPVLRIDTADPNVVINKEDKSPATLRIDGGSARSLTIRGRGNSTWGWVKKPYRLQLDSKAALLGMPSNKNWVLLANMADRSLLRTTVAMSLGAKADALAWTPRTRPVELVLNDQYMGAYVLAEHVRRDPSRVAEDTNLFELDQRFTLDNPDGDQGVITERKTRIALSDPDEHTDLEDDLTLGEVADHLNAFEDALVTHSYEDWKGFVDLPSFVDFYLITELMKGVDADCWTSCFFTWTRGERITMGPLWDFDQSGGYKWNAEALDLSRSDGWWVNGHHDPHRYPTRTHFQWFGHLWKTPEFRQAVAARWQEWRDTGIVGSIVRDLSAQQAALGSSLGHDWERWSWAQTPKGRFNADSPEGEVAYLRNWLTERIAWMTSELAAFAPA